jgi:hypothetical protein
LVVRKAQIIDLYRDSRTTSANYSDHLWSAEQSLGITGLEDKHYFKKNYFQAKGFLEPNFDGYWSQLTESNHA